MTNDIFIPELLNEIDESLIAESEGFVRGGVKPMPKGKPRFARLVIAAAVAILMLASVGVYYLAGGDDLPPDQTGDGGGESTTVAPVGGFVIENGVLMSYVGDEAEVSIPEGVITLSATAFKGNTSMQALTLSSTVETIEDGCLEACEALREVRVAENGMISAAAGLVFSADGKSVIYINHAEVGEELVIPEGVEKIGYPFWDLETLRSLVLPSTVTKISDNMFDGCYALESISLGGVTEIGDRAFSSCPKLSAVRMPNVRIVGVEAFRTCKALKEIDMPAVRTVKTKAFYRAGLEKVSFGDELAYIWDSAFEGCPVGELTLPASIKEIGPLAFYGAPLAKVYYQGSQGEWLLVKDKLTGLKLGVAKYELVILGEPTPSADLNFISNGDGTCTAAPVSKLEHSGEVIVPEYSPAGDRVTAIGSFKECVNITAITLPQSVTEIPASAFYGCSMLERVVMPGVKKMGEMAFISCVSLQSVEYSEELTVIPTRAFCHCPKLSSLKLHEGLLEIGEEAFFETGFTEVVFPSSIRLIGERAFNSSPKLVRADLSGTTLETLEATFLNCTSLSEVVLPKTLKVLGASCFERCSSLKGVELHEGLTKIGPNCFDSSGLESIEIPDSVTDCSGAFFRTEHLKSLTLGRGIKEFTGVAYMYGLEYFVIPEGMTEIPANGFRDCRNLREIVIPESVKKIGAEAFTGCDSLVSIKLPKGITELPAKVFYGCASLKEVVLPERLTSIGESCFESCKALETLVMPKYGESIGIYAFRYCESLVSVKIPEGVTSIGERAFGDCPALVSVELPTSLETVPKSMFALCTSLKNVKFGAALRVIDDRAFQGCTALVSVKLPEGIKEIGEWCFSDCSALSDINIPASLDVIGDRAFDGCNSIKTLTLPASPLDMGTAFDNCLGLEKVIFEDASLIRGASFKSCTALTEVVILKGELAGATFAGCTSLSKIDFSKISSIVSFSGCTSLPSEIVLSDKITSIGDGAFASCSSLERIVLPEGCTEIGRRAFRNSEALREITIGKSVTVERNAFEGCTALETVRYRGTEAEFAAGVTLDSGNDAFKQAKVDYVP